jgi:tetratricopeptide (TPR) repeat protein
MRRFTSFAIGIALTGALAGGAHAQSQAEIAAKLNEDGKELMYADKYAEAAKKFQEAVARVPEAKYFVNLCTARLQEGKLDEALTACNAVELNNPTPDQKSRAEKLVIKINDEAKKQHLELHPGGGGGGNQNLEHPPGPGPGPGPGPVPGPGPNQPPSYAPAVGRPLGTNLVMATAPDNRYTWTLGIDLFGGGGRIGQADFYGTTLGGFRLKGDYLFDPGRRFGAQGYIQYTNFTKGSNDMPGVGQLTMVDIGVAVYKHFCLGQTPRLCVTPLAGLHLSTMSPEGSIDSTTGNQLFNYDSFGGRAELALTYAFGRRFEHALSLMGGANFYTPVFSGDPSGDLTVAEAGLDKGGATGYFGLGYTYRFNTPIGASPFVILE